MLEALFSITGHETGHKAGDGNQWPEIGTGDLSWGLDLEIR